MEKYMNRWTKFAKSKRKSKFTYEWKGEYYGMVWFTGNIVR